ncbi:MAG: hypothetical protein QE278_12635, partial [Limnobacter sp.]|nr:hypothetical protein [Limnobacter sp.]
PDEQANTDTAMSSMFDANGAFTNKADGTPNSPADVKALFDSTMGLMGDGEPIQHDLAGQADPATMTAMNALTGKPAGNTVFTDQEINAALAMGLITMGPNGQYVLTPAGQTYATAVAAAPPGTTPTTPTTPPAGPAYTAEQQAEIDAAKEAGAASDSKATYSREDLEAMGIPPVVIDWMMRTFGVDGVIPFGTMQYLEENGFFAEVDDVGGHDDAGSGFLIITDKLIGFVTSDPALGADPAAVKAGLEAVKRKCEGWARDQGNWYSYHEEWGTDWFFKKDDYDDMVREFDYGF